MAAAVNAIQQRKVDDMAAKDQVESIPEIIEERRKDAEGRQVVTKYTRGKLLGKGGFAKCFLGTHMPTLKQYALKIVYKSTLAKSSAKHKLQTEIKIHRTLKHAYVVKFERFFEDNTNVYMVLELCSNNSMSNLLKRRKRLTDLEVRYYLMQLVSALQYLHENLVIHRDLKLGNLFIDSQMRLKVGDFGLATRLSDRLERKKTFCGTPNYIAPEVLEGKCGHSFEVDIWSTGVILYTLLVGRPPFESKNVESTYKRILANSFSFPDQPETCEHAKSLLTQILQAKPEARPSLDQILQHSFFMRPGTFTPIELPEIALRELPSFSTAEMSESNNTNKGSKMTLEVMYGNENDPQGANRNNGVALKQRTVSPSLAKPALISSVADVAPSKSSTVRHVLSAAATSSLQGVILGPKQNPTVQDPTALAPPQKRERLTTSSGVLEKRPFPSKFEIFEDIKSTSSVVRKLSPDHAASTAQIFQKPAVSSSFKDLIPKEKVQEPSKTKNVITRVNRAVSVPVKSFTSSSSGMKEMVGSDVDRLRSDLECIQIDNQLLSPSGTKRIDIEALSTFDDVDKVDLKNFAQPVDLDDLRRSQSAWAANAVTPRFFDPQLLAVLTSPPPVSARTLPVQDALKGKSKQSPEQSSQPMQMGTPTDQIIAVNEYKALCTLECMHQVLSSRDLDDLNPVLKGRNQENTGINRMIYDNHPPAANAANIWVVRYVDYTSKYGLGFLLNTGSAGVYFNDSTKIVVSPDGTVFQYSERKRKEKGSTSSEHTIQTHSVARFPVELQKKVTLLRHFRNYLVDQHKGGMFPGDDGSAAGGSEAMERMATFEGASSGASSSIPFGASSIFISNSDARNMGCLNISGRSLSTPIAGFGSENPEMPFLKKWVRTKHAILFRLSNRTVQVLFMDRSEVLLTSEARMVTYVSKQNVRSEHSLEEVLQTGRSDIAKRLKYAKDIMYRLITSNVK